MNAFWVFAAECVGTCRKLRHRAARRPSMAFWFAVLFPASVWIVLRLAEFVRDVGLPEGFAVTEGTLLFLVFLTLLGKGAVDAYHRIVDAPSEVFSLSQPVSHGSIVIGKFLAVVYFNLAPLALALVLAVAFVGFHVVEVPLPFPFFAGVLLAFLGGIAAGTALALAASLSSWRRKVVGIGAYAPVLAAVWALTGAAARVADGLPWLGLLVAGQVAAVPLASAVFLEAWNNQTRGRARVRVRRVVRGIPGVPDPVAAVAGKELRTGVRRRELILPVGSIAVTAVALPIVYGSLQAAGALEDRFAVYLYPILAMAGVLLCASIVFAVGGLASVGKELRALWILKVVPQPGRTVMTGKTLALLVLLPPLAVTVPIPIAFAAGFGLPLTLFVVAASASIGFLILGLGLWFGASHPNFDEDTGGLPDAVTQYNLFLFGLVVSTAVVGLAGRLYEFDRVLGILGAILLADGAALFLFASVKKASRDFDRLDVERC